MDAFHPLIAADPGMKRRRGRCGYGPQSRTIPAILPQIVVIVMIDEPREPAIKSKSDHH
jgi:hypothetical protein